MVSPGGLKTAIALKLLRTDADPGGDAMSRLRDEGRLLAALRHPSILRAYDLALLDGRIGLVTEYVEGEDLHGCLPGESDTPVPPRAAAEVVAAVGEALAAAWDGLSPESGQPMRLVHRDIKPSNIRLGQHGEVKLLDFGIARSDEVDREARTGTGSTVGSLAYMAPERFSRTAPGPQADVYALGCTFYEALVGVRLHADPVPVEMFRLAATPSAHQRHVDEALDTLDGRLEGVDAGVRARVRTLLDRMLAHDPSARPTASEAAREADRLAEVLPGDTLKRWARDRVWPDPEHVPGSFDGRTITEGTLSGGQLEFAPRERTAETFSFEVGAALSADTSNVPTDRFTPPPAQKAELPVAPPERGVSIGGYALVGLVVFLLLGGIGVLALSRPAEGPQGGPTFPPERFRTSPCRSCPRSRTSRRPPRSPSRPRSLLPSSLLRSRRLPSRRLPSCLLPWRLLRPCPRRRSRIRSPSRRRLPSPRPPPWARCRSWATSIGR